MSSPNGSAASSKPVRSKDNLIVEHHVKQLQEVQHELETERLEKSLTEAWENRELMATLMEEDWRGLRLLAHLRSSPMVAREVAAAAKMDIDSVAATLARLLRFGAADLQDGRIFTCADKGQEILKNLEENASVRLTPQSELAISGH